MKPTPVIIKTLYPAFALLIITVSLQGCSTTSYSEYRGSSIREGHGGTVRTVNGIDFWENGTPDRKYKIVGVIDDSRGEGLISRSSKDSDIAAEAKARGGDGVIFVNSDRELKGVDLGNGDVHYKRVSKFEVIQYVK